MARHDDHDMGKMFETRSHAWREVGLARQLSVRAVKRARIEVLILTLLTAATVALYVFREELFGIDVPIRLAAAAALLLLGFGISRDLGRIFAPALFRRMDPGTAGTIGFLIRLFFAVVALLCALRVGGVTNQSLVPAAAASAVILGLAAQQTLGNVFAGVVLLSARPFVVGDRVRLQGGDLAGELEGTVSSLGLLHTVFTNGEDSMLVPNRSVLNVAIVPLREPAAINLRARLRPGVTPLDIQQLLQETVETRLRGEPRVLLEEIDGDEVIVRIIAAPEVNAEGPKLASEVLAAIGPETRRFEREEQRDRHVSTTVPHAQVDFDSGTD
ncbi:MAG TPA: mechanosensitive ion channel domain-containing protein [Solirubrobacteraceae bacterium]|nr:mechanosensitive ion channel domain-containing protein [Solirubrobacteraceae bacterium]